MTGNYYRPAETGLSRGYAGTLRKRIRMLIFFGTLTVALAFGMSFYYGLVSGSSSIAGQFPELESTVEKMKSMLLMNTIGFVAVIVASFYLLARLVVDRAFVPLALVERRMCDFVDTGRIPDQAGMGSGPFASMDESFDAMVSKLSTDADGELKALNEVLDALPETAADARAQIEQLVKQKARALGRGGPRHGSADSEDGSEVFMQPV